jgi:hypothetical protein
MAWVIGDPGFPLKPLVLQGVGSRCVLKPKNFAASIARSRDIKIRPSALVSAKEEIEIVYLFVAN